MRLLLHGNCYGVTSVRKTEGAVILVNTVVGHVISHVLLSLADDLGSSSIDNYLLKVYGLSEYLTK